MTNTELFLAVFCWVVAVSLTAVAFNLQAAAVLALCTFGALVLFFALRTVHRSKR